jgi:hypothetical protein
MKGGNNMEMQENEMQKIPSDIMQMITYEAFCRFKASGKVKRAMAQFDEEIQRGREVWRKHGLGTYYPDRMPYFQKHDTGEKVVDSYYPRIKDLDKISFISREYVNTTVYHVIPGGNPDDLKCGGGYVYRKELDALADQYGVVYLFNKCVGRARKPHWEKDCYDIVIRKGTDAIADSALADNYLIVSLTLPDSVTVIGTGAIERSRLLTKVTLSKNLKYIKDAAFRFCWELQNIDLPEGLLYIGADAFRKCESFTELKIPDSVTYIGSKAFYKCVNLKSVMLPAHITKISLGMFRHCHQLTEIVIPDDVTVIEKDAFANCYHLEKVTLPSGLKRIEDGAFADCIKLWVLEIPDSVEYIGENLFGRKKRNKKTIVSKDNQYVRAYAAEHRIKIIDSLNEKDGS